MVPAAGGAEARFLMRDLRFTIKYPAGYDPFNNDGTVKPVRPDVKLSWSYATPYDFRFAGFPKPTSQDLTPEEARGFMDVCRTLIADNSHVTAPLITANGLTVQADRLGLWFQMVHKGVHTTIFLHAEGYKPYTSRNGGKWFLPPADAKPFGLAWGSKVQA